MTGMVSGATWSARSGVVTTATLWDLARIQPASSWRSLVLRGTAVAPSRARASQSRGTSGRLCSSIATRSPARTPRERRWRASRSTPRATSEKVRVALASGSGPSRRSKIQAMRSGQSSAARRRAPGSVPASRSDADCMPVSARGRPMWRPGVHRCPTSTGRSQPPRRVPRRWTSRSPRR